MLTVRRMETRDIPRCMDIINHIISVGGSTAHEDIFTIDGFAEKYFADPKIVNVAETADRLVGFQAVFEIDPGVYLIASFTDQVTPQKGAGRALITQMIADCRTDGGTVILAKITSDNTGGLAFYASAGFADWEIIPNDHQSPNGQWVDRVIKRYPL